MLNHLVSAVILLNAAWPSEAQWIDRPNLEPSSTMSTAVKAVIGVIVGVFGLIIIFYIFMFFYLRKHGKSFIDFLLLRRRRGLIEVSHHHHYNQAESGLNGSVQSSFQQPGSDNPYTFDQSQGPRMPEPVHSSSNWPSQTSPNPPTYMPPQAKA
ncbi:unnamed protein product [Rhizoctonia solani]|uniref:Uncharacterized protein n=1 Tax=Rhizoctonia solani TaxID=456999 RepID=A0A8H2W762_9AGAM|nr:unnamed protein product [Rhizoctonia solani]